MTPRKLLLIDFSCALAGGFVYLLLSDFIVETLLVPRPLAQTQMIANFLYGIYGVVIYLSRTSHLGYLKFLVAMNFIYASLCAGTAIFLFAASIPRGGILLVVECAVIAFLARFEWKTLKKFSAL